MDAIVEDIHAKLDILLVQHLLLSDAQLMGIARRVHNTMVARGLDISAVVAEGFGAQAVKQEE